MRTTIDLIKHKQKIKTCSSKFIMCRHYHSSDIFHTEESSTIAPVQLFCRSYFCPECAKKKKNILYARAMQALKNDTWRMITLTTVNDYHNRSEKLIEITKNWNSLLPTLKKYYPHIKYIRILEVGKLGMVHLHVLVNCKVDPVLLSKIWYRITGAFKVDAGKEINHKYAINYMLKYITKQITDSHLNNEFFLLQKRRFSFSYNIHLPKKENQNYVLIHDRTFNFSEIESIIRDDCKIYHKDILDFDLTCVIPDLRNLLLSEIKLHTSK